MSCIYFHSEHGEARLSGRERAYAGVLCSDLMLGAFGDLTYAKRWLVPLLREDSWIRKSMDFEDSLRLGLRSMDDVFVVDGEEIEVWLVSLNTAWVLGGDPLRLLARLHGQCEIHCWVDGPNRQWLASIMRDGRECELYRPNEGWESVIELLESRDDGPVVCSYSVCESFPGYGSLPDDHPLRLRDDDDALDDFYEMPPHRAWADCMENLRSDNGGLEMKPERWEQFRFGNGMSAFSLLQSSKQAAA